AETHDGVLRRKRVTRSTNRIGKRCFCPFAPAARCPLPAACCLLPSAFFLSLTRLARCPAARPLASKARCRKTTPPASRPGAWECENRSGRLLERVERGAVHGVLVLTEPDRLRVVERLGVPERPRDELPAAARVELAVQTLHVVVHGVRAAPELVR